MRHSDAVKLGQLHTGWVNAARSDLDIEAWTRALRELPTGPVTEGDFRAWLEGPLRRVFPCERFYGAYGSLSGGRIQVQIGSVEWP